MKNKFLPILIAISFPILSFAQQDILSRPKLELKPILGYQREHLDWSIAGKSDGTSPNIFSELIWKDMAMGSIGLDLNSFVFKGLYVKGQISKMEVLNGFANDSDYSMDNRQRTENDYRQDFKSNKGNIFQYQYGLGYQLKVMKNAALNTELGRMYKSQKFYLLDFEPPIIQEVNVQQRSTYQTYWEGWTAAVAFTYMKPTWTLQFRQSYQQLNYDAKANWVLIQSFAHPVSFTHKAKANGWLSELELKYRIYPQIQLVGNTQLGWMNTAKGIDQLFYNSGNSVFTQFNGAHSKYYAVQLGLNFQWK